MSFSGNSLKPSSPSRGRSVSPSRFGPVASRSTSVSKEDTLDSLKWSIINHDPSERIISKHNSGNSSGSVYNEDGQDDISDEEQISDDDTRFEYDDMGNILPNFASSSKINEVSNKIETSSLVERMDRLAATERAIANAQMVGSPLDNKIVNEFANEKLEATGDSKINYSKFSQDDKERKEKLKEYSLYKKKLISTNSNGNMITNNNITANHTNTNGTNNIASDNGINQNNINSDKNAGSSAQKQSIAQPTTENEFLIPFTSDVEEKIDFEIATKLNDTIKESAIDSSLQNSRCIQTITRGDFFNIVKQTPQKKPKMFLLCMDFSPESIYALEWCIGTVLVDGSILFIVCVIEETDHYHSSKTTATNEQQREKLRLTHLMRAKEQALNLLKLTKLQIHMVIEVIHHPIPRHLITELIDNIKPTLVVVGSKGQSAIKGVLLGSLSNYLVTKSSVPVMVVREKLKKIVKNKSSGFSNNIKQKHLSEARID